MFESIIMRPNSGRRYPLDMGQMIENLFFYQKTTVHLGRHEIKLLFDLADVDVLVELLKNPALSIHYNNSHVAVGNINGIRFVDSVGLANLDIEKELYEQSFEHRSDAKKSKRFSEKLSRLISVYQLPPNFSTILNTELQDSEYRNKVVQETIRHCNVNIDLKDLRYELEYLDNNNFKIHSNFLELGINPNIVQDDSPILSLITACEDIHVAAENHSEILLPDYNSKMLQLKVNENIKKTLKSQKEIEVFNHFNYDESWALREAINTKALHVKAILPALRNATKYKGWISDLPEGKNLLWEYIAKVEEKSVLEKLPSKAVRFYIYNGLGIILSTVNPAVGIPVGIALSAFDTFIFDKLLKSWKPNNFIENELKPLAKK